MSEPSLEIESLNKLNEFGPDDLFICCASFEERCLSAPLKLVNNYRINYSIIFAIEEPLYQEQVSRNLQSLKSALSLKSSKGVFIISCRRDGVADAIAHLSNIWRRCKPREVDNAFVTIDISGFTKIYLLQLLHFLIIKQRLGLPRMVHTTQTYLPTKLTKGVNQITTIHNFYGDIVIDRPKALVIFLGFESDRTLAVWKHLNPERTIALLTSPPRNDNDKYVEYAEKNNSHLLSQPSVERRDVPSDNPYSVRKVLETVYSEIKGSHNMVIAPFGTKSQLIGIFLFCLENPRAQVVYAHPMKYTRSYLWRKPGATLLLPLNPAL